MTRAITIKKEKGVCTPSVAEVSSTVSMWMGDITNGVHVLSLSRYTKPRTNEQNHLMWLWFSAIADAWSSATGKVFTRQNVHDAYCLMFLPQDTPKGVIAGSTSVLNTEQMTEFLNRVRDDAQTEYGIVLPDPDDFNFAAWAKLHEYR